jgi:hypothetical protein
VGSVVPFAEQHRAGVGSAGRERSCRSTGPGHAPCRLPLFLPPHPRNQAPTAAAQ